MTGLSYTGSKCLFVTSVSGCSLVPEPPARITAFMAAILYHPCYSVESMPLGERTSVCVILAYNCANVLENTYRRIPRGSVDRIILVDDASTDDTLAVARRLGIECYTHGQLGDRGDGKYLI